LTQQLTNVTGQIKPCLEASLEIRVKMQALLDAYQAKKTENKQIKKEIGRIASLHDVENSSFK
jgi:hypothetical protein